MYKAERLLNEQLIGRGQKNPETAARGRRRKQPWDRVSCREEELYFWTRGESELKSLRTRPNNTDAHAHTRTSISLVGRLNPLQLIDGAGLPA